MDWHYKEHNIDDEYSSGYFTDSSDSDVSFLETYKEEEEATSVFL